MLVFLVFLTTFIINSNIEEGDERQALSARQPDESEN